VRGEERPLSVGELPGDQRERSCEVLAFHIRDRKRRQQYADAYDLLMPSSSVQRSETRTISIRANPSAVFDLLSDASAFPRWAPAFAPAIRPDGDHWIVERDGSEARIAVRVSRDSGTVDILRAERPTSGAFMRVLPNGEGSELLFTLFFPAGTDEQAVVAQMTTVEQELEAVRSLCEASPSGSPTT
jgi:uncharacterized protein YndB with AHSA1/START domain